MNMVTEGAGVTSIAQGQFAKGFARQALLEYHVRMVNYACGRGLRVFALLTILAAPMGFSITVTNGGSFLNDFELVGRWVCSPAGSGLRNCNDLAFVQEGTNGYLYALSSGGVGVMMLRKVQLPAVTSGVVNVTGVNSRALSGQSLTYSPNYHGGALWGQGTYFTEGWGYSGGSDNDLMTPDATETNLLDPNKTMAWYYYNGGGTFLPAKRTLTGRDAFVVVRNGGSTPHQDLMMMEPDTNSVPNIWAIPQLSGRGTGEDDRSLMLNLSSNLGVTYAISAEFCDYSTYKAVPTLYILAVSASDPYHLIAVTPGPDGVFGETSPGVCDDQAMGYTFGEPGTNNTYLIEKRHITGEHATNDTSTVDIQGGYSSGFSAAAYDPRTGYIYLHGAGDYAAGVILRDKSWRSRPPPPGLALIVM
jgi:hypothetical protein